MNTCLKGFLLMLGACLSVLLSIHAGEGSPSSPSPLTDQELDNLLAPIALYPDPLLAQLLPASTYPGEIADAAAWLQNGGDVSGIDNQNWDESVKAIAHYPTVLNMMSEDIDWTADLGNAFLTQPEDVTRSIQRLRWQAKSLGNLASTSQQTVITDGDDIEIDPAQPQYIYVPQYDPSVVYVQQWTPGISPFITFGIGFAIGGWLTMDFDWYHHHVIFHGWNRPGWVNNARPYVHVTNVYVNRSRPSINQIWRHDNAHGNPERYLASRPGGAAVSSYARVPEARGRGIPPPRPSEGVFGPRENAQTFSNRGKESLGSAQLRPMTPSTQRPTTPSTQRQTTPAPGVSQRPTAPTAGIGQRPTAPAPGVGGSFSRPSPARENVQPAQTPSSAFGGYRGANEASAQSLRGQTSRQSSVGASHPPAPANRISAPVGRKTR
ncbi:MAG: DUF3300 domain-containing protein [Thermodesulfovibrionales bacterium]